MTFEPYLETAEILKLSRLTGIPAGRTPATLVLTGLIKQLNHKGYFEEIALMAGAEIPDGIYADSDEKITEAILEMKNRGYGMLMLKKAEYAGGAGNLSGSPDDLLQALPAWYNGGGLKIEEFLNLETTIGSLALLRDDDFVYMGDDEQIFDKGLWSGFHYPCKDRHISSQIKDLTMKFAEIIHKMGARGYLNMDWGIVNRDGKKQIIAIEINFRHNGLSCMVELASGLPGGITEKTNLLYYGKFSLPAEMTEFKDLTDILREIRYDGNSLLIEKPDKNKGVIISTPILEGKAGLLIVGDSPEYTQNVKKLLNRHLYPEEQDSQAFVER
jgi:hypothetical protein